MHNAQCVGHPSVQRLYTVCQTIDSYHLPAELQMKLSWVLSSADYVIFWLRRVYRKWQKMLVGTRLIVTHNEPRAHQFLKLPLARAWWTLSLLQMQ